MQIKHTIRFGLIPSALVHGPGEDHKYTWGELFTPVFTCILYPEYIEYSETMGDFGGKVKQVRVIGYPIKIGHQTAMPDLAEQACILSTKLGNIDETKLSSINVLAKIVELKDL